MTRLTTFIIVGTFCAFLPASAFADRLTDRDDDRYEDVASGYENSDRHIGRGVRDFRNFADEDFDSRFSENRNRDFRDPHYSDADRDRPLIRQKRDSRSSGRHANASRDHEMERFDGRSGSREWIGGYDSNRDPEYSDGDRDKRSNRDRHISRSRQGQRDSSGRGGIKRFYDRAGSREWIGEYDSTHDRNRRSRESLRQSNGSASRNGQDHASRRDRLEVYERDREDSRSRNRSLDTSPAEHRGYDRSGQRDQVSMRERLDVYNRDSEMERRSGREGHEATRRSSERYRGGIQNRSERYR